MRNKILGFLAIGLLAQSAAVSAATVTYNFFVNGGDLGPLAGVSASGSLSFDDSIVPAGGGPVDDAGVFSDLAFTWNGISYTAAAANTGYLEFDANGKLINGVFGTDCHAGDCSAGIHDPDSWLISLGLGSEFAYDAGDDERLFFGPVRISLLGVPEPGTLALLGLGVIALALGRHLKGR